MAILLGAVLISGTLLYTGSGSQKATVTVPNGQNEATPTPIADPSTLLGTNDAVLGSADATVTIVEFSDFQCPFCRTFFTDTYHQLIKEYIDTGKVKLVFRHFPLPFHTAASPAALATLCAKDQGKFWQLHDAIFTEQKKLGEGTVSFTAEDIAAWAKGLGLNMVEFNQCVKENRYSAQITADITAGTAAGVNGTPSFFVNGNLLVGAQPFSEFKKLIDAELER